MVPVMEGLELSETYIVDGVLRARPGMPVNPVQAGASAPAQAPERAEVADPVEDAE